MKKRMVLPMLCLSLVLLNGCSQPNQATVETDNVTEDTEYLELETETEQAINELQAFHGTWEGTVWEGAVGTKIIMDCNANENGQKVLISFITDTTNFYYMEAEYKLEDKHLLVWWNDKANRATIDFGFDEEAQLMGTFAQYSSQASGQFTKTSETPADEKPQQKLQENLIQILKENNFARKDSTSVWFGYDYDNPQLAELKETYNLERVAGEGDTQSKAIRLLNWVSASVKYAGGFDADVENHALALLEYSYQNGIEKGLDCYHLSVVLEEACLSLGIQARTLLMMPANPLDVDTHVVVMAYIPEQEDWIMLDPSYNAYLSDLEGNVLAPKEIREKIANREEMKLNAEAQAEYMQYYNYLAKDMFSFSCIARAGYGSHNEEMTEYYLTPAGFEMKNWYVDNLHYRSSTGFSLSAEEAAEQEEVYETKVYIYATEESFWK